MCKTDRLLGKASRPNLGRYRLHAFSPRDSVYILEYPGYGEREGKPSRASFDAAALEAYQLLRAQSARKPVCVAAESIGSGPCMNPGS